MNGKKIALGLAKLAAVGGVIGGIFYLAKKALAKENYMKNKYRAYYNTTIQWLNNKNEDKKVGEFFKENDYKTIAIYGMGNLGELFYNELKESNPEVKVAYFIDKKADELYYGMDDIEVVGLEDISSKEDVDAIIITPVGDFDKIMEDLDALELGAELISLEDILYEI